MIDLFRGFEAPERFGLLHSIFNFFFIFCSNGLISLGGIDNIDITLYLDA